MTRKLWVCGFPGMCMYNYIYIYCIFLAYIDITISYITIKYTTIYYTYNITITILPYYISICIIHTILLLVYIGVNQCDDFFHACAMYTFQCMLPFYVSTIAMPNGP